MCLAVYLASDRALPEVAWNAKSPAFYLEPVSASEGVRKQFAHAHVYYAGSHEGCGCGFSKDGESGEDLVRCQQNYVALARVTGDAISRGANVQLFTCWEGDQGCEPESVEALDVAMLESPDFELKALQLLNLPASTI